MAVSELNRIIQAMHQGVLVHSADGAIIHVNQATADALGLTIDQVCGRTSLDPRWHVLYEDGSPFPGGTHPSSVTLASGEPQRDVIMGVYKSDGTLSWLSVSSEPLYLEDGKTIDGVVVTFVDITEQERSKQSLESTKNDYRALFDNLVDTYYRVDGEGLFTILSPSAYELSGYQPEELLGTPVADLYVDPDGRSKFLEALESSGGHLKGYEAPLYRKDGSQVWVATSASYRQGCDGKVCCIEGTVRDISEKKHAEEELCCSELLYRQLTDNAHDMISRHNAAGDYLYVSPASKRLIGYEPAELVGRSAYDFFHPDDLEEIRDSHSKVVQNERNSVTYRYRHKDGHYIWLETTSSYLRSDNSRAEEIIAVSRDISDRKQAEGALRDSEELFRAFFQYAPFGAVLSDHNGKIFQSNLAIQKFLGYSEVELLSLHFKDYTVEEDIEPNLQLFNELIEGKRDRYEMEKRYLRKDGQVVWGALAVSAIRNSDGSVKTLFSLVNDITDRIEATQEQGKLQRQLQQAQKMEAIGQLTGGIAHDFNNILSSILGYSQLALDHLLPPGHDKLANALAEINRGGERAAHLVEQMLDFSRGVHSSHEPVNVEVVINEVLEMAAATIPSSIQIEQRVDENVPTVTANPVQLYQVLLNLIINARDAMDGKGLIIISVSQGERRASCSSCHQRFEGEYVEISICDSVGSLSGDVLERAFDPFFTTKEVGRGTGMGLSMVHGILHEWGGHVSVALDPGIATTFNLYIPCKGGDEDDNRNAEKVMLDRPATEALQQKHEPKTQHIMVVDDEVSVGSFVSELLKIQDYRVTLFSDSREALRVFKDEPDSYDLLLTDQTMPHMTGVELIEALHVIRPSLPVILCSGYSEMVNQGNAHDFGIDTYLDKPIDSGKLFSAIGNLLVLRDEV